MNHAPEIWFPHLGIQIQRINPVAFSVFGISVYWYGIIIGFGVILALWVALQEARRTGQNPENYMDFLLYALITAVVGARAYYVIFSWDQYVNNWIKIFTLREGGLAIYGAVIAAIITAVIFCRKRNIDFWLLADTAAPSLILGQAIGRWGNFINQEAFGGYTDSLFAMRLLKQNVGNIPSSLAQYIQTYKGAEYIQVHPTFLYESFWNLCIFIGLLLYKKHKKFTGEVFLLYAIGYAAGRVWIEGLRTDQLLLFDTGIAISQVVSVFFILFSFVFIVHKRKKI